MNIVLFFVWLFFICFYLFINFHLDWLAENKVLIHCLREKDGGDKPVYLISSSQIKTQEKHT